MSFTATALEQLALENFIAKHTHTHTHTHTHGLFTELALISLASQQFSMLKGLTQVWRVFVVPVLREVKAAWTNEWSKILFQKPNNKVKRTKTI